MGVDGGAGNAISLSEVQTFYGGSNPISLSEYYRNGSLVPGDQVAAQSNTSGSSSQTIGQFTVAVSGVLGSPSTVSVGNSVTVLSTTSRIVLSGNGNGTISYTRVTAGGSTIGLGSFNIGGDDPDGPINFAVKGPNYDSADGSVSNNTTFNAGDTFQVSASGAASASGGTHTTRAGLFDVTFKNNNALTLTTTSGSTGGAQTYTQDQTRTVKDDDSSNSYTLGYDAILGNTNVPASGTINMNVFNAPGSATP
jgi:hypothetical protein